MMAILSSIPLPWQNYSILKLRHTFYFTICYLKTSDVNEKDSTGSISGSVGCSVGNTQIQWCALENQQSPFYVVDRYGLSQHYIP